MIFLPIILWWAQAPMRFATGRRRIVICAASILAVGITTGIDNSRSLADDRYAREDATSSLSVPGIMAPQAGTGPVKQALLREGTLIPATSGRIVMIGRRWAFVPTPAGGPASGRGELNQNGTNSTATTGSDFKGRLGSSPLDQPVSTNLFGKIEIVSSDAADLPPHQEHSHQWIVGENLMLQRIVDAIHADPSDDHWTITGEVTEFFKENRLIIRTARRSMTR